MMGRGGMAWFGAGAGRGALAVTAALLLGAVGTSPPNDLVALGRDAAVVTAETHATAIGLQVLRDGGNAVDAAVAVALALAVTHPQAGNLGGGAFFVVRMADGTATTIDCREMAPRSATAGMYLKADGSVDEDKVRYGASAAGVPGTPAGLWLLLQKFGTRSLPSLAAPALRLAREGIVVDPFLAADLWQHREALGRFASTRAVFFNGDRPLQQGEILVQKDLAATLERFAKGGHDGFYKGATAELLTAQMVRGGGFVTAADLSAYVARERAPLRGTFRGHEVLTMGPPSSGGVALVEMLNLLEGFELAPLGFGGSEYLHLLTEVMARAYADRSRWLGDPDHYAVPLGGLTDKQYAAKLRESIRRERKSEVAPGVPPGAVESDDTTHFSIVDRFGNAVACTTTINDTFGAHEVVAGAGFLLNNEMDDFSAKPGVPNQFGLVGGKANAIAPHKRMLSSMTPTLVLRDGQLQLVLGSPGGGRIINAVLQVLLARLEFGLSLPAAVQAPRIHYQWQPATVRWELLALPPDVRQALAAKGHTFDPEPRGVGQVLAIEVLPNGQRLGVCDHRSGGSAGAY